MCLSKRGRGMMHFDFSAGKSEAAYRVKRPTTNFSSGGMLESCPNIAAGRSLDRRPKEHLMKKHVVEIGKTRWDVEDGTRMVEHTNAASKRIQDFEASSCKCGSHGHRKRRRGLGIKV